MDVGKRLKERGIFPGPDDFVPAIDVIVRHSCKNRWYQLVGDKPFTYFDLNDDGVLDRAEVQTMLTELLGYKPMDFVVDDMIASIDRDGNGVIDQGEFSFVLAQIERDHGRFWGG
ncbi:EF hand domain containing protein [Nitzschia inconspicua]|uniref:EF hand domain containing protein n=1 Tax=Nitzschia inconspicua TaxID=303405 RepID=A0A9K3KDI4_9STRA|nr:EF hand domain containing protein [Nitzschia inconspicua]